ncbi:MAG: hypothetical protein CBB78_012645 [Roseibacillus sp. TMED18]|nr:MAG: hypothetical protein CBB78_012645 [Roseibacillus sp. TMED18]
MWPHARNHPAVLQAASGPEAAGISPEEETEYLRQIDESQKEKERALEDLEEAKRWSTGLDEELQSGAVEGVISHYASLDPVAASNWLGSLPTTTNLDSAIRQFAWRSQRSEPELAADWIGQIQDSGRRDEMYNSVLSRWLRADPFSAEQWIETTPDLPEGVRSLPNRIR